jgi:hypothetical protein
LVDGWVCATYLHFFYNPQHAIIFFDFFDYGFDNADYDLDKVDNSLDKVDKVLDYDDFSLGRFAFFCLPFRIRCIQLLFLGDFAYGRSFSRTQQYDLLIYGNMTTNVTSKATWGKGYT